MKSAFRWLSKLLQTRILPHYITRIRTSTCRSQAIQYYTLSDWRSKRNAAVKAKKYQMTDDEAKLRITELERENAELRKANDILKDALGFFAKDRKK